MARIKEDILLIKVSRLLGDKVEESELVDESVLDQLTELFSELAGPKSIVEIEKLDSAK